MIGEVVSHYRLVEKIGEGGMGVVYRAEDVRLGRHVAVKFLSAEIARDPSALERFQREARAASAINHPHICALYDVGSHEGQPFLVMELLEGRTLRELIGGAPLPLDLVLEFGLQIADALDAAHSQGIIHRDIKPLNIFVTGGNQVKILDFGLAKLVAHARVGQAAVAPGASTVAPAPTVSTGSGLTLGTVSHMSPEQARGEELDARSDLFSIGVVLYEMATGREPFTGRTSALVFDAILHQAPPPLAALNPSLPAELEHIVSKALEKDRDLRTQTAREMRAELKRLKRATEAPRVAAGPRPAPAVTAERRTRRMIAKTAVAGVAALLLIAAAVTAYRMLGGSGAAIDSVAVLPFTAGDGAADAEYLTDGLSENLINSLSQLPGLRVSARSVVFRYKKRDVDPLEVGRELNVRGVITGRVIIRGGRLVIQADLMDVADGSQLWGAQYNRPMADLLAVQEDIAGEIFEKLRLRLTGEEKRRATRRYTDDAEAFQLYLQGRYHWNRGTIAALKQAIAFFQRAIDKDPKYALAHAGLADSYLTLGSYWVEAVPEAKIAAERAIELDPSLAEAHVALGHIKLWLDWDWSAAEREFKQGIALNPSSALARNQYAMYLATLGRLAEAIAEGRQAQALEPLSPIVNADLGWFLLYAGRNADAIAQFRRTLELDSSSASANRGLGLAYSQERRYDDAISALKRAVELAEGSPNVLGQLGYVHGLKGDKQEARQTLRVLEKMSERAYVPSSAVAVVHVSLGETARAIEWLEQAYEEHDFSIVLLRVAPWFKSLHGNERFERIVDRIGLPR